MRFCIAAVVLTAGLTWCLVLRAEPPARPAELKELDRLVGTWKVTEFVSKQAEWTPKEIRTSGDVATTQWIMDGWVLEDRKTPVNGTEHLGIWHYDQAEKAFHYTMFQAPGGHRTDLTMHWNEKAQAFEGKASLPNGVTMRTSTRFPKKETKEWQVTATDADGKVYLDMTAKEVRTDKGETAVQAVQAPEGAFVDEAAVLLQGFWRAQSVEIDGKLASDKELAQVRFDFSANKLVFKIEGPEIECTFKADPKQSPKHLDLTVKESDRVKVRDKKVILAIYELTGDMLKISLNSTDKRPTEFAAKEKSGQLLIVLKKQKR